MKYSIAAMLLCVAILSEAQILEVPLSSNPALFEYQAPQIYPTNVNKTPGDTIDIPFLDDFNYESLYPTKKYWEDEFAYVNKGFGVNPPTLGVATLDGLNENGAAYANSGSGVADYMTSKPIFLGNKTAVDNVYLSFFYQKKGFGDKPEIGDSLVVEFKNSQNKWVSVARIPGVPDSVAAGVIQPFNQYSIEIDEAQFLFDGFQFRFKNYASLTGSVDHWHLDYVRVTENTTPSFTFSDVAFMRKVQTILENYTAMPWRHFKDNKTDETITGYRLDLSNNFSATQNINPSQVIMEEAITGTTIFQDNILSFNEPPIALGNIPVGKHVVQKEYSTVQFNDIITNLGLFDNEENLTVNTYFIVNPSNQDGALPATLLNDTAKTQTIFDNYFAYDDGSAELAIVGGRLGDEVAVKFRANVPDTLRAIQLFIPRIAGDITGQQRFNLKVWIADLNTTPAFEISFAKPVYVDSLNGWTIYSLDTTPVYLPIGDFYIGWQQATDPSSPNKSIPVGYDRNNNDKVINNYMNIGNGWQILNSGTASIQDGAIMIRAIVGDFTPFTTDTEQPKSKPISATIYPNPTNNYLFVQLDDDYSNYQYRIVNVAGQILQQGTLQQELNVSDLSHGVYFLNIRHQTENINLNYKFVKN
jgi:hypothetical protein